MSAAQHVLTVRVNVEMIAGAVAAIGYEMDAPGGLIPPDRIIADLLAPLAAQYAEGRIDAGEVARVSVRSGCGRDHPGPCPLAASLATGEADVDSDELADVLATVVATLREQAGAARLSEGEVERLAEVLHDAYEVAATGSGWATQPAPSKPWSQVPEANRAATRAGLRAVLAQVRP